MIDLILSTSKLTGVTDEELQRDFGEYDLIRQIERYGIRKFMTENRSFLTGRVLDFGAGTMPYKEFVSGEYIPFHKGNNVPNEWRESFDCIMCNQVLQYIDDIHNILDLFEILLKRDGCVVITYATNWDEVETDDHIRITKSGMESALIRARFSSIVKHECRARVVFKNFKFPLGYGVIAQK